MLTLSIARDRDAIDDRLDLIFRALADRTRRAQLARLIHGTARVTELAAPFNMSLPAISKHLKVLEHAGLISREIEGRVHHCRIKAETLQDIEEWLDQYREFWQGSLDSLARHVEEDTQA